jgi:hypothetical protein
MADNDEVLLFELLLPKTKPIFVGTYYRPPTQSDFLDRLERFLIQVHQDCKIIVLGDFNICTLNTGNPLYNAYNKVIKLFGLTQLITEPTRVTDKSKSLIDHILCSDTEKICQSGVINTGVSDHSLIYCTRNSSKTYFGKHNHVKIRSTRNYDKAIFINLLTQAEWSKCFHASNVNENWCTFKQFFMNILDNIAPVKESRLKQKTEPWMSSDILDNIHLRDQFLLNFRKSGMHEEYKSYCRTRHCVKRQCRKAKCDYLNDKIDENKHNPKKLWSSFRRLGYQ